MLKKTISYTDYNGNEKKKDFYFNLSKSELYKLNFSEKGGLENYVKKLYNEEDGKAIINTFQEIILMAYGEKSADGEHFMKIASDGHRLGDDFAQTPAFDELFMELATDADKGAAFINGVVPKNISDESGDQKVVDMNNA